MTESGSKSSLDEVAPHQGNANSDSPVASWTLSKFPKLTYSLILALDPDRLLEHGPIAAELSARAFQIVRTGDPVVLRHQVESVRPWRLESPLIIVAAGALTELPYDL